MTLDFLSEINTHVIAQYSETKESETKNEDKIQPPTGSLTTPCKGATPTPIPSIKSTTNKDSIIMDATFASQNITFPTDLKLLNAAREKSEELINKLYDKSISGEIKVRTYRKNARKEFLNAAKKRPSLLKKYTNQSETQLKENLVKQN